MTTLELLEIYTALFETWRFQVNTHWQRSSFFAAFETVALAACWKLFANKPDSGTAYLGLLLAFLGVVLTLVWLLMNNRTHSYALYWLSAVGKIEIKLINMSNEPGIDFATKILDDKRSTVKRSLIHHRMLEGAVPALFIIAWVALFIFGLAHFPETGFATMRLAVRYETVSLAISIASLLVSVAAALIASSSLSQAKHVAARDQRDWNQRKWFDLYFKADEAHDALDRFQALYPSTSAPGWNSVEMQRESHELMRIMRTVHRIALVFPQNPAIQSLFDATAAFENMDEATSKERLTKIFNAVDDIRQKALLDVSVLSF
jgi:hypothetical protein